MTPAPASGPGRAAWPGSWVALGLLALLLLGAGWVRLSAGFKGSPLLRTANAGTWIRRDTPYQLNAQPIQPERAVFRRSVEVTAQSRSALIEIAAREEFLLFLDHGLLYACRHEAEGLEQTRSLSLPAQLPPGPHELEFVVIARHSPPLCRAQSTLKVSSVLLPTLSSVMVSYLTLPSGSIMKSPLSALPLDSL